MPETSTSLNPWCSVTTFANTDSAEAHESPSLVFQDADGDHIQRPVPRSTRFHEEFDGPGMNDWEDGTRDGHLPTKIPIFADRKARRVSGLTDRFRGRLVPELRLHQLNRVNLQLERRQFESRYLGDHSDIDQDSPLLDFVSPMDPQAGDLPGGLPFELEVCPAMYTHDFRKPEATSYQHTLPPPLEASEEDLSSPLIPTEDNEALRSKCLADRKVEDALRAQHLADTCRLCHEPLTKAVKTPCGHICCKKCMKKAVRQERMCPWYGTEVRVEDVVRIETARMKTKSASEDPVSGWKLWYGELPLWKPAQRSAPEHHGHLPFSRPPEPHQNLPPLP
ncbi:unnamed protein product [Zymoseptoria tritici ST99CH_3D1]|nr:unnamed protein product [Zymoseptoria tritici ST99CH_3D1]